MPFFGILFLLLRLSQSGLLAKIEDLVFAWVDTEQREVDLIIFVQVFVWELLVLEVAEPRLAVSLVPVLLGTVSDHDVQRVLGIYLRHFVQQVFFGSLGLLVEVLFQFRSRRAFSFEINVGQTDDWVGEHQGNSLALIFGIRCKRFGVTYSAS